MTQPEVMVNLLFTIGRWQDKWRLRRCRNLNDREPAAPIGAPVRTLRTLRFQVPRWEVRAGPPSSPTTAAPTR